MQAPQVLIRADASAAVGSGHVMRCLALAEAFADAGRRVGFACRALDGDLRDEIAARGLPVFTLPLDDARPWSAGADAGATLALVAALGTPPDWVIVDHYGLGADWHRAVAACGASIAAIDDLADRPLACDALIDQNAVTNLHARYPALTPAGCARLLGPQFTLLRRDIRDAARRRQVMPRSALAAGPVIVFMGGADRDGLTQALVEQLDALPLPGPLHVLAGAMNPHQAALQALCRHRGHAFGVAQRELAPLLAPTRAAIVACGMFAVELQALGVPCVLLPLSDIQRQVAHVFEASGRAVLLEPAKLADARVLPGALQRLWALPFIPDATGAVAPDGAWRVARALLEIRP
jgi:UDP-2,4-diacetamido-2,4,6-trideoxy-beta-L-altropyranose hydrolase